ncbi:DUF2793 domain-containing protein [Neorhizobium sp. NCHU2750]|uniref:DUF2793 domain-containing protein n=1 Tax=Neorhizobium sp. NCHU2750 TaxID=1825976 RepID=UPI000E750CDE|nr:hypothetical protein NCHU2750_25970 [Neorhizobium sp. NCHU2750]
MSDQTANLEMPFILPSQAQKHVTHNEALLLLDAVVQLSIAAEMAAPPASPVAGQRFLLAASPSGAWTGHAGEIAIWQDGTWAFVEPKTGWQAWFETGDKLKVFDGASWQDVSMPENASATTLGISASADATNRLAVASPASLFTHAGNDHRMKVNKAAATDTASLLFQSGWTGYAEMGLAGNTDFSIKVSNGTDWKTGLAIDSAGRVTRPSQPVARAYRSGTTFTPTAGQQSGVTDLAVNQGGFSLGAAAAGGGNALVVPATGLYLLALTVSVTTASAAYSVTLSRNGSQTLLFLNGATGSATILSATAVAQLQQGDTLTFIHSGSATIGLGQTGTNLSAAMI